MPGADARERQLGLAVPVARLVVEQAHYPPLALLCQMRREAVVS